MQLRVNGDEVELANEATIDDVLQRIGVDKAGLAVAVDSEVVPRTDWTSFTLRDGQRVEVLRAVQGG
ncbi:MAG: sulfur carrier protein ThiS [Actinomycetota bacterium]|nr:sulfur carrier protein ThiS [Actinomycetota bacterium]